MGRRLPSLTALRAFESAARNGSFKQAAEELCVSQSAISHQIKDLEKSLGIDLFERHVRAVKLTVAGATYYPQLREAFDKIQGATTRLVETQAETVLNIQTYSTLAIRWLIPLLSEFSALAPDIDVRVITDQNEADFYRRSIDAAIMIGQPSAPALSHTYLFTPTLVPVGAPELRKNQKLSSPEDLKKIDLLQVYPSEKDWLYWLNIHNIDETDVNMIMNLDSYDHALKLCARGIGVTLGMQPYIADDLANGSLEILFPKSEISSPNSWYLIYPEERANAPHVLLFEKWLISRIEADPLLNRLRNRSNS